ncbi:MAG TPA: hypothetical protein VK821_00350, partial [Dehalococcoidia bacterium]|nr:hypothetical protein [Dehalococcoidia bacterium]
ELAEHYAQSTDAADLGKALQYSEAAAERATSVFAYGEAERHLEQALKVQEVLDPDDRARRCDLLLALGRVMLPGEEPGRAAATVAPEAFTLAEALGDSGLAARAAVNALEAMIRSGGTGAAVASREFQQWAERADQYAAAGTRERIYADVCLGLHTVGAGRPAAGHVFLRRAVEAASQGDDNGAFFMAASWTVSRLAALEDRPRRIALAEEVLRRSRQGARTIDVGVSLGNCGEVFLYKADRETAEAAWQELAELAERSRDATLNLASGEVAIITALYDGRLEEVESLYAQQMALGQQLGVQISFAAWQRIVRALLLRGLAETPEWILSVAQGGRPMLAMRAQYLAHLGRHEEARAIRERFGDIGSDSDSSAGWILVMLLEAAVLGKDADTAGAIADRLERSPGFAFEAGGLCVPRLRGGAAMLLGEPDKARACYQEAIEVCMKVRCRPELALTHLELAELLLDEANGNQPSAISTPPAAQGQASSRPTADKLTADSARAEALAHLDLAIGEFRDMKMQPALERALRHKDVLKA